MRDFRIPPPNVWELRSSGLCVGIDGCPETLVQNYHYSLRNNPKERSSEQKYIGEYAM